MFNRRTVFLAPLVALACVLTSLGLTATTATASPVTNEPGTQVPVTEPVPTVVLPNVVATKAPPGRYVMPRGSYFSFPNRGKQGRNEIRGRVLAMIRSTWGGGTIRIATWSFRDKAVAKALIAAKKRGVSVQIVAAQTANKQSKTWKMLKRGLGTSMYKAGHPETADRWSFARECRGACRGRGGTPHAKYFMFDLVGPHKTRTITVQGSMNLTTFAANGQWNAQTVSWDPVVHSQFLQVFNEAKRNRPVAQPYRVYTAPTQESVFFPMGGANPGTDPMMRALAPVICTGGTVIRVNQYAIYGYRGTWLAKRLRQLWDQGCNVAIIYSVSSRPVKSILLNKAGRGRIPMRQSATKNKKGELITYNHSKWLAIRGNYGGTLGAQHVWVGSSNWSDLPFSSDEQYAHLAGAASVNAYWKNFTKTWGQRTSTVPTTGRVYIGGRSLPPEPEQPVLGKGIYKHLDAD